MKKFIMAIMMLVPFSVMGLMTQVFAADPPVYDATFDNNQGAFYANGTGVVIDENATGETVITWNGGTQVVPNTVTVFGGGTEGTNYDSSNVIMNGGTVGAIFGGGISRDQTQIATVGNATVTVNDGTVLASVNGGGLIYTTVNTSNVVIQGGRVAAVEGGGIASAVIDGVEYAGGTEADPENSLTRVNNANVTINGGTIDSTPSNFGLVYGGGQGYSYTGNANLMVNSGDLSNAFVTSGGSNGFTGSATTRINGGDINILQTVNRGSVNSADVTITGGTIQNAYVGGETGDPTVTGTIDGVDFKTLGGTVQNLEPGKSGGTPIVIDQDNYSTVTVPGTVVNNDLGSGDTAVTFDLNIVEEDVTIPVGGTTTLTTTITTTPAGNEDLFDDIPITWTSSNPQVATVDQNGVVTGIAPGTATITATLLGESDTATVTVTPDVVPDDELIGIILFILLLIVLAYISYRIFRD